MAVFIVKSPNPKYPGHDVVNHGTTELAAFRQADADRSHFVSGRGDPAIGIFREILKVHLTFLRNLRELI